MKKISRRLTGIGGAAAAVASAAVLAGAGTAAAAPVTVYQIPSTALTFSGLVVPGPYFANVQAQTTGTPGVTAFSAPATPYICSSSAGSSLVRINYLNVNNGRTGSVTVKPCPNYIDPTPHVAHANTGAGQVVISIKVTGSHFYPNAGQPSLPGVGTFAAR